MLLNHQLIQKKQDAVEAAHVPEFLWCYNKLTMLVRQAICPACNRTVLLQRLKRVYLCRLA